MAFNPSNSHWISGYTSDGTNITIPIASIANLTSAEAHTTTGDIRKLLFHLCAQLAAQFATESGAGNAPGKMVIQASSSLAADGVTVVRSYFFQFTNTIASDDVANE
jgi:hypothetical protein